MILISFQSRRDIIPRIHNTTGISNIARLRESRNVTYAIGIVDPWYNVTA